MDSRCVCHLRILRIYSEGRLAPLTHGSKIVKYATFFSLHGVNVALGWVHTTEFWRGLDMETAQFRLHSASHSYEWEFRGVT